MSSPPATARDERPLFRRPPNAVAYVAVLAALVSAAIHLLLAPRVIGFNQTTGTLFFLNGFGFLGGTLIFLSRYWRRELYLVAAGYALATIVAFLVLAGPVNPVSIVSKTAEAVLALAAVYLYTSEPPVGASAGT